MKPEGTLPEVEDLAAQIGEFIHYWGFKRIHGRIWSHLYLAQKPLDAADLVRQMKISKALVSISLRELLDYEVIEEVGKSNRGTHLYRTNPDIMKVILSVLRQREKRILARIQAAQETLERVPQEERTRNGLSEKHILNLGEIVTRAQLALEGFVAMRSVDFGDWREAFLTTDPQEEEALRSQSVVSPSTRKRAEGSSESKANNATLNPPGGSGGIPNGPGSGGANSSHQKASGESTGSMGGGNSNSEETKLASGHGMGFRAYLSRTTE